MTSRILVAYATKHGTTADVAHALAAELRDLGATAEVRRAAEVGDVGGYELVVLGAPLYVGRWHRDAHAFLRRFAGTLDAGRLAVFAVGPVQPDGSDRDGAQRQLDRALAKAPVAPGTVAVRRRRRPREASLPLRPDAGLRRTRLERGSGVGARARVASGGRWYPHSRCRRRHVRRSSTRSGE